MSAARTLVLHLVVLCLVLAAGSAGAADTAERLQQIRDRLRQQAGAPQVPGGDADLPLVSVTVLPGDSHRRLAVELAGTREAEALLRRIEPKLATGQRIFVPRALLRPQLSDLRSEPLSLDAEHRTLWSLVQGRTGTRPAGTAVTVRNVQRLNHIVDPSRLHKGATVLVPRGLLERPAAGGPALVVDRRYRVQKTRGLARRPAADEFPATLRRQLERRGVWQAQLEPRVVDLVVVHTTEHRGAPLDNVARYMNRNRLANYLVGRDGAVYELVPEVHRAFGCGESLWEGRYEVDHEAINVELLADTAPGEHQGDIPAAQYAGLSRLLNDIRARYPQIHPGRIVTHRMVAFSYTYGTRSRKGDPYVFDWAAGGLPDNSVIIDQDVLLGRAKLCTDQRYSDRVTEGQTAAARFQNTL